jgi:hypothetical protein
MPVRVKITPAQPDGNVQTHTEPVLFGAPLVARELAVGRTVGLARVWSESLDLVLLV